MGPAKIHVAIPALHTGQLDRIELANVGHLVNV
jgi:hypothetical protein